MAFRVSLIAAVLAAPMLFPAVASAKYMSQPMPGHLISGVPEPATWGLMLLGFGLMGALLRIARRRKVATA